MVQNLIPTLAKSGKVALSFMTKNSNAILTTTALLGLSGTVVSLIKAVPKVQHELKKVKEDVELAKNEEVAKKIKAAAYRKVALICFVPVLMFFVTAGSIIGNAYLNNKKIAALAAAYALSEQKVEDLEDAAEEIAGKKKAQLIEAEAGQKDVDRRASRNEEDVIDTGRGTDLFWEPITGHWLRANRDFIRYAFSEMNGISGNINCDQDDLKLNNLFDLLKLPSDTKTGDILGWRPGDIIGCNLNSTGIHYWDNGKEEYFTYIEYRTTYLGKEGQTV